MVLYRGVKMNILYLRALKAVNYELDFDWTLEMNLRNCFIDFFVSGTWNNLDKEDLDDISTDDMAKALLRIA
jgi:hypothetical protein